MDRPDSAYTHDQLVTTFFGVKSCGTVAVLEPQVVQQTWQSPHEANHMATTYGERILHSYEEIEVGFAVVSKSSADQVIKEYTIAEAVKDKKADLVLGCRRQWPDRSRSNMPRWM